MALPTETNIDVYAGDTWSRSVQIQDGDGNGIDVTGWTFLAQVRESRASETVEATFTVTVTTAASGELTITLDAETTAALDEGKWVWDLQATKTDSSVQTLLQGVVSVTADVTRSA